MIEINLLPPEHRPVERTPLPRLIVIFFGVLLSAAGLVAWLYLSLVACHRAEQRWQDKKLAMEQAQKAAAEVQKIERELKAAKDRENVLRDLFNQRIPWARLLDRLVEARAKVKVAEDVVLLKVELRKTTTTALGRSAESRQLYLQGFVASGRKEATAGELRETCFAFIQALRSDSEFKRDLECDEKGDGNAKYTYLGDQMSDESRSASREIKDPPKAVLTFEVTFNFKPPATAAAPGIPGVPGAPAAGPK